MLMIIKFKKGWPNLSVNYFKMPVETEAETRERGEAKK